MKVKFLTDADLAKASSFMPTGANTLVNSKRTFGTDLEFLHRSKKSLMVKSCGEEDMKAIGNGESCMGKVS